MPHSDQQRSDPELGVQIREAAEPVLHAVVGRDPNHDEVVHDLLNTTVEKVLRYLQKGHEVENLAALSKTAARNVFKDWLRWKARHPEAYPQLQPSEGGSAPDWFEQQAASSLTPSREVIRREDVDRHAVLIDQAWDALAPMERAVLDLRFREGRTRSRGDDGGAPR